MPRQETPLSAPVIGRTIADSVPYWPERVTAPEGAPNVVVIMLDDVGFASYSSFGSSIRTPNIDRLAQDGVRMTNFHTQAVCSPTRASMLTGRHAHAVGFGHVTERLAGYPGYSMRLPDSAATMAEVLRSGGYSTWAVGKWHLAPSYETGPQGPFERWPLGRGFERFYGFLGGSTDQFEPELYRDNSPVDVVSRPAEYHVTADFVDESIRRISEQRSMAPNKPFMLYLALGAAHAPHQAPREWIDAYRGAFDHGWDEERRRVLARQIDLGVMPATTELGESNPGVQAWEDLSDDERALYARMMETYAGFISHTDAQIGRLLDHLEEAGVLDDTLIMLCSDNGASAEGGPEGSVDEGLYLNDEPQRAEDSLAHMDELGGPLLYNHYPWGWAQAVNTPFRWYKQFTHAGGITNGLFVRWPGGGVPAGEIHRQYHHVVDIMPTVLEAAGIEAPAVVRGVEQQPIHGTSMRASWQSAESKTGRTAQHYEMWGNRGYWRDGWMAICRLQPDAPGDHPPAPMTVPFEELPWELYNHTTDPSEVHDLAEAEPERLREMIAAWWEAAAEYQVLPVDTRPRSQRWPVDPPAPAGVDLDRTVFVGPGGPYERGVAPAIAGGSFRLRARFTAGDGPVEGVLYTAGGHHGGYCWYAADGQLCLETSLSSVQSETVSVPWNPEPGDHEVEIDVRATPERAGIVDFRVDGVSIGERAVTRLLKRIPIGSGRTWVGKAPVGTAERRFAAPFAFTGRLREVSVETPVQRARDDEAELREQ